MPTRNVNITQELDRFVRSSIESGRYENACEVVRAAFRSLERDAEEHQAKLARLRTAIDEGDASGVAEPGVLTGLAGSSSFRGSSSRRGGDFLLAAGGRRSSGDWFLTLQSLGPAQTLEYIEELENACQRLADLPVIQAVS